MLIHFQQFLTYTDKFALLQKEIEIIFSWNFEIRDILIPCHVEDLGHGYKVLWQRKDGRTNVIKNNDRSWFMMAVLAGWHVCPGNVGWVQLLAYCQLCKAKHAVSRWGYDPPWQSRLIMYNHVMKFCSYILTCDICLLLRAWSVNFTHKQRRYPSV